MASVIELDMAYDWAKRCGELSQKLVATIDYLSRGNATGDAWVSTGDSFEDAGDMFIRQLRRAPDVLKFARQHLGKCNVDLIRLNGNRVGGYRAAGEPYHHAHGALVGVLDRLCTTIESWDDRTEVSMPGHEVALNERQLRENLTEYSQSFVDADDWVSHQELRDLLHHAEAENVLAKAALESQMPVLAAPAIDPAESDDGIITIEQIARLAGVEPKTVREHKTRKPMPEPKVPRSGRTAAGYSYNAIRPWAINEWPARGDYFPALFADAEKKISELEPGDSH